MNNQLETAKYKDLQVEEEVPLQAACPLAACFFSFIQKLKLGLVYDF